MLPKTISSRYELYEQKELLGQSSSKKCLYIDKKTKTVVFVKLDSNGKRLFWEYTNQQFFYKQSKKLKTTDIIIPKPLEILKVANYLAIVMEYFPSKSLLKAGVTTRLDAYTKVLKFLEKLNTKIDLSKKYSLSRKSATGQFITLPYFLSKNLMLYLSHAPLFLRSANLLTKRAPRWMKLSSNWICHGDINVDNILLSGEKVIIVDFAYTYISHRYYDISRVLNSTWYQEKFHEQFWDQIVGEFSFDKQEQDVLKSFVVFNLMQRLSQRYTNLGQEHFYLKRLEMILTSL